MPIVVPSLYRSQVEEGGGLFIVVLGVLDGGTESCVLISVALWLMYNV